jgi:hypothetical protein
LSLDALRITFANVTAFQNWVGKSNARDAKERIHIQSKPKSGLIWPYLIVKQQSLAYHWENGSFIVNKSEGADLIFEMLNPNAIGTPDDYYSITNPVGLIIEGLMDLAGVPNTFGYINEPTCELMVAPHWLDEGEQVAEGSILSCTFKLTWS